MNAMSQSGKRNLAILIWMGLAGQAMGVLVMAANFTRLPFGSSPGGKRMLSGLVAIVFGMALGGWAGNLREIAQLKERLAK